MLIHLSLLNKFNERKMINSILKNIVLDFVPSHGTKSKIALFVSSMLGVALIGVNPAGAVTFGTNLIVDGDAEASVGLRDTISAVSGWMGVGTLTSMF
jgi:hypothetical protein